MEEGALLLVAWNAPEDELFRPGELERSVTAELDSLAARLRARIKPEATVSEVVKELSRLMFEEEGFAGNQLNYYDPNNSLLDHVLASRQGIPISLSVGSFGLNSFAPFMLSLSILRITITIATFIIIIIIIVLSINISTLNFPFI